MAQLFAHIKAKAKAAIGNVKRYETKERITVVDIPECELLDLLSHFACEKSGLDKSKMISIELHRSLYGDTDINHSLIAKFKEEI